MQSLSDLQLLLKIQQREQRAFRHLFERYWELLFSKAYNMVGDEDMAKDIVQDIFIQLWEKPKNNICNLKAYLLQSVKYQSYAILRKARKLDELLIIHQEINASNQTEETILLNELSVSVNKIIKDLPNKCQQIFQMSRFEHMKNAEIAKKMNIKEKTVENQINKALNYLRQTLITAASILFLVF